MGGMGGPQASTDHKHSNHLNKRHAGTSIGNVRKWYLHVRCSEGKIKLAVHEQKTSLMVDFCTG